MQWLSDVVTLLDIVSGHNIHDHVLIDDIHKYKVHNKKIVESVPVVNKYESVLHKKNKMELITICNPGI